MSWSVVVVLVVLLLVLLQVALWQRRWRIRRELLSYGTRVSAQVVPHDPARGDRSEARDLGRLLVAYRTKEGEEKRALKVPQRRGDAWMAGEPAAVIYDPHRPNDIERLMVGFGRTKKSGSPPASNGLTSPREIPLMRVARPHKEHAQVVARYDATS